MDESEDNMSSEDIKLMECPFLIKAKPKKRSLVERELETNLTARVTSPALTGDTGSTSRYGRARRAKTDADYIDTEKGIQIMSSPVYEKTPVKVQSPVYKMHASNSPIKIEPKVTPMKVIGTDSSLDNQIESIYHENISLSRFGSSEKKNPSPGKKLPKVYVRKDLIQTRDKEEYVAMIKNLFSPPKSAQKSNNHLNNILERSSNKYSLNTSAENSKSHNSFLSNSSVVKTLDFDNNKKKKENREGKLVLTKSDIFDMEAKCEYQVGDLAWARMGTFPFWPCIVTREPASGMFVKKKLFGRIERDIIHVTFFGDNGRRGWIVETMLRKFLGQLEFEATKETFSPSAKKKDPRLYAAFFVSEKKMPQWNISVEEAETLLREPKRLRIDILCDMLAKSRSIKSTSKHHKSEKITRTASDVASDVSLSESLYDTLFSEDDLTKSEDTERSRSKTRMSLDVSEVVTACLDNMAAKTGITKIQRQSHMDRWLQKAKSKTPEKTQANFTPPQKEKDVKVGSAKKMKKISPIRVPIQKPYSLRKSSYEPQILKSHDNEHDYSAKTSNDPPQTAYDNGNTSSFDTGMIANVESLYSEACHSVKTDTKGDQTIEERDAIDSVLNKTDTEITSTENANNTIRISSFGIADEQIYEIQVDMCSVEENDELLLEHIYKPIEDTHTEDKLGADKKKTEISIKLDEDNTKEENKVNITKQTDKLSIDVKKTSKNSRIPQEHVIDIKESDEITKILDKQRNDKKKSNKTAQKIAGRTKDTENPTEITQASADHRKNTANIIQSKLLCDFKKNSAEFVKYLELRQDALIDEHPELSQDEIEDYLYKTWQYEESSKSDFNKKDDITQSGLVKGLNINLRHKSGNKNRTNENKKGKKCLSLNSNASKKRSKRPDENTVCTNPFLSSTSFSRSPRTKFSISPAMSVDIKERITCVSKEGASKEIAPSRIVTEHSYTEKLTEMTQNPDELIKVKIETTLEEDTCVRRSIRSRLSNTPAMTINANKMSSESQESTVTANESTQIVTEHSYTEKHSEMTKKPKELEMRSLKLLEHDTEKAKNETIPIVGDNSIRRSLRTRLSNSPAMTADKNKSMKCVYEDSTVKKIKSSEILTEHTEIHCETTKKPDELITDTLKLSKNNISKEKIETTQIEGNTSVRRGLRTRLSKSPAMTVDTNERMSSVSQENTVIANASTQIVTEHSYTEKHSEMTQKPIKDIKIATEHSYAENLPEMDTPKLSEHNMDEDKFDTSLKIIGDTSIRRSLRTELSNSPAMSNYVSEDSTVKEIELATKHFYTENHPEMDTPKLSEHNLDKEKIQTPQIERDTSVRRSLRTRLSHSPATSNGTNTVKEIVNSLIVTEHSYTEKHSEITQTANELDVNTSKLSKHKIDKEKIETKQILDCSSNKRSLRIRLSNSPALTLETNRKISCVSEDSSIVKEIGNTEVVSELSYNEKHSEMTKPVELEVNTPKLSKHNTDKEKIETTQILDGSSGKRSLRIRLSNSPALTSDTNKRLSCVSEHSSTVKEIGNNEEVTELSCTENHSGMTKPDELEANTPKLSKHNTNKEKIKTTQILDGISGKRSLRIMLSHSPALTLNENKRMSCLTEDSGTMKEIENSEAVTKLSYTENHTDFTKPVELVVNTSKLSKHNTDKEKIETTQILDGSSGKRSFRIRLSNSPALTLETNKKISCISEDSSTVKEIGNTEVVTELSYTEKHSEMTKPDELEVNTPKLSKHNTDKEIIKTTQILDGIAGKRSLRIMLSHSPALTLNKNKRMRCLSEDSPLKEIENSEIVTEHSEMAQKPDELMKINTSKLSEDNIDNKKVETTQSVGKISIRKSLRSRLSNRTAMSVDTNKKRSSVSGESSTVKAKDSTLIVTENSYIEKHPEMTQNHEDLMDREKMMTKQIEQENSLSAEKQTKITHVADEPKMDSKKQVVGQSQITLVTNEHSMTAVKQKDIMQVTVRPIDVAKTDDHSINTLKQADTIQKAIEHNLDTTILTANTKLIDETCIDKEKSKQTEVTEKASIPTADSKETIVIAEITYQSCIGSKNATDVTQTVNTHSIDIKNQNKIIKQTGGRSSVDNPITITQIAKKPSVCKQVEMTLVKNEQPIKNAETELDEYNEYGHLDFIFKGVDEKLSPTNDVGKPIIENVLNNDIGNKYSENAEIIHRINFVESCDSAPNIDSKTILSKFENRIEKSVNSSASTDVIEIKNRDATMDNLNRCKYEKLQDSCTEFSVRIERLPRPCLAYKNINIKDLEYILLGNANINSVKTSDIYDKNSTNENISENLTENAHDKITCIAQATDKVLQNVAMSIDNQNNASKISVNDESIENIVSDKISKNDNNTDKHDVQKHANAIDTQSECAVGDKVVLTEVFDKKASHDKPQCKQNNESVIVNTVLNGGIDSNKNNIEINQDKAGFQPVKIEKPENVESLQIKPSPLVNGFEYIYDDDEDEFESPAFSPIFKEPIETTPDKNEDEKDCNNEVETVTNKNDTNVTENRVLKDASPELPHKVDLSVSTKIKNPEIATNIDALMKKENDDKDEIMKSVSRLPEPVKMNGFHLDGYGLDFSNNDFNVETSSVKSEDSEPLSVTKTKILSKINKNDKITLQGVEFIKYLELRQDALMDEHPELNQDEIVEYLYKTWQYEENSKSDMRKNDDIEQASLVKGLNDNLRQKSLRNSYRENKKRNKKRNDDTLSLTSKMRDEDSLSINSDVSDTSTRRRVRRRLSNSPAISLNENEFSISKESSPERKPDIDDKMSIASDDSIKLTKRRVRNQILDDSLDGDESFSDLKADPKSEVVPPIIITIKQEKSRPRRSLQKKANKSPKSYDTKIKKYFAVVNPATETINNHINEKITIDGNKKIKEEYDPETVSVTSIHSEDSEACLSISLSKRKRKKADKHLAKTMDDPEFLKYVELRQDVLIDENPQLTQEEIVAYLFKTWLYEESVKSDLKKSDDIEQANLVKGLNSEVQPKKIRKKIKVEKNSIVEEDASKEKPKRKISQPYYNEDILSDIEDEIELFEIFKTMKKPNEIKSEESNEGVKKTNEIKSNENVKTENEEIVIQDEIDEVELYFSQLPLPKPNLFKSLVREKVCEICEKTGNLVKCKGCSGMFHANCEMKAPEGEGVVSSTRGRKKKNKKRGRKPKDFEDSESHSDEKSQDVSEEHNASIEEIDMEPRVVDEAVIEAALTAKMKEILPTIDLTYDSYSSDDGLDWNSAPPGHCEIVDVKVKPKVAIDYSDFKCKNCQTYTTPVCFVCKVAVSKTGVKHRQKCQTNHCNKYYHLECLDHWPQTQFNSGEPSKNNKKVNGHFEAVMCPRHVCHTCVSDDPRGCRTRFSGDKLARCVRCPATYHSFTKCLPAGTQILTGSLIVCPRHYENRPGKVPCHVNTGWCFICALGGSLICCEYCPTSFHAECLNIEPPEGGYMCEDCETGRLPLYGEMVWVKLGHYRWWPGIILHPSEIPENIMAVKHSPGEFVVRFFGQYDHYWVNRGRVFHFQEGDSGRISTQKSKIDAAFITAMEHAHRAFEILKTAEPNDEESIDIASSLLPPHYVKLKVNKPCGSLIGRRPDIEESSLTQCECDPLVEDPCGPYSHCLNRMLLTECGPICRAGDRCSNRAFEKRLYPKMVPYRTPHRGWGLKTLVEIKAGQFVIEYVGELLDEEDFKRRMNRMHEVRDENFYFLTLDKERMIDAGPKGNLARFMNHCCEPNCETQKWTVLGDVRVGLFAINDIPANSELTFNYNLECTGIEKKRCLCGARRCSGYIGAKPKQEETQPRKKRAYKKRAKPADESPSTSKIKPKRPVGRPAKPRELTEIEKDLLIIKNATNGISSDSESSSRLSIDNLNPKALKRKRVDFSTEESVSSSPITKKAKIEELCDSPSAKKAEIEELSDSPSAKKAKVEELCDSPSAKKAKIEKLCDSPKATIEELVINSPSAKKAKIEELCDSSSTKKANIEEIVINSPSAKKAKIEEELVCDSPSLNKSTIEEMSLSTNDSIIEELSSNKAIVQEFVCDSPKTDKVNIEEKSEVGD